MENIKFSIIIPIYNSEKYLNLCLDSILHQTYRNWECILVDDGSTDSSGMICDKYAKEDVRFKVFHKSNGGVSKARNFGLENSTGLYITFVDSDDEMLSNTLELYNNALITSKDIDIIKGGYIKIYEDRNKEILHSCKYQSLEYEQSQIVKRLNESSFYHGFLWNECISHKVINSFRFDTNLHWNEDNIFSYQCFSVANSVLFIPQPVYKYYVRKRISLSNIDDPFMLLNSSAKILSYRLKMLGDRDLEMKHSFEKSYVNRFIDAAYIVNKMDNEDIIKFKENIPFLDILKQDYLISCYLDTKIPNYISKFFLILKRRINLISNKIKR